MSGTRACLACSGSGGPAWEAASKMSADAIEAHSEELEAMGECSACDGTGQQSDKMPVADATCSHMEGQSGLGCDCGGSK